MWPWQKFMSVPYNPPLLTINQTNGSTLAPGFVFVAPADFVVTGPAGNVKQTAPVIMADTGDLIWNGPSGPSTNFRVQQLNGESVLTYWSGYSASGIFTGHGYGSVKILNTNYHQIARICPDININFFPAGNHSCVLDLHESKITDRNTLLAVAYNLTQTDLTSVGGLKNGYVFDCLVFEIALDGSQKILFQWSALDHVPVNQSQMALGPFGTAAAPYDYFHLNSVDQAGKNYLISSRAAWSAYLVNPSGKIEWTIEGNTGGDFGQLPVAGNFRWQHDVRAHNITSNSMILSMHNNYNSQGQTNTNQTVGLALKLPLPPNPKTPVKVVDRLTNNPKIFSASQGSYDPGVLTANDHQFMAFGQVPMLKEYSPQHFGGSGALWSARFGDDNRAQTYRAFKQVWHATPSTNPTLFVQPGKGGKCGLGYVSWNGATDVTSYNVYQGPSKTNLCKAGSVKRAGFETQFGVSQKCVQVGAVEATKEVRRSAVFCTS